jgi:hypothetical protein
VAGGIAYTLASIGSWAAESNANAITSLHCHTISFLDILSTLVNPSQIHEQKIRKDPTHPHDFLNVKFHCSSDSPTRDPAEKLAQILGAPEGPKSLDLANADDQ